ncbi:MAG: 4-(cytidine 5'-diphospho)-2-C-methyl-D-erythritol kinase [Hyphomicrobiales bacterium]|nr:4-(cytidine 5'-diphospho)-2-C-methyl-D-erythritol kinase [Hyphomicrobiales bacterium]MDE2285623.1 4-(cytidine 5'-diphospho)-2-C-methyl-D-erythritol kinase [Hyphomicrobiales bacterium]
MPVPLVENALAKVNLTLRVIGRRVDGYHDIESLVVFADFGDRLTFSPGDELKLSARGPGAAQAGEGDDNLVLKAARALIARRPKLAVGAFDLDKRLPVAAGLGGGSADAAAALRLLARVNKIASGDPDLRAAAEATGADVPVCFDPRARIMRGIGELLSAPIALPPLPAVLANPGVAVATKAVFAGLKVSSSSGAPLDDDFAERSDRGQLMRELAARTNDLEKPAMALAPVIGEVLAALRSFAGCELARMSGSGATCFAIFDSPAAAGAAAKTLAATYPKWWVQPTILR